MAVELSPFDDQQVKIAVRADRSAPRRPNPDDLFRRGCLYDPLDDVREHDRIRVALFLPRFRLHGGFTPGDHRYHTRPALHPASTEFGGPLPYTGTFGSALGACFPALI